MSAQNKKRVLIGLISSIVLLISVSSIVTILFKDNIASDMTEKEFDLDYDESFFDNLQELNITETYINVKKDGKWGYINKSGDIVIDFKYNYATPFRKIEKNNKIFEIALVVKEDRTDFILKDERTVVSYKTETDNNDYNMKYTELVAVCTQILAQPLEYHSGEIAPPSQEGYKRIDIYENDDSQSEYDEVQTYRYEYTNEYDIVITKTLKEDNSYNYDYEEDYDDSNLYEHKYELVSKRNKNNRIKLECNNIQYDEYQMEIFKNDYIPYFDVENEDQGWFTPDGNKMNLQGKYRILDFIDNYILIKSYENNMIFFVDYQGKAVSPQYKEIYILDTSYIVKNENNKCAVIGKDFKNKFAKEYDIIDPKLYSLGLYVCANINDEIIFNSQNYAENINYEIIDLNGNMISNDFYQQVYSLPLIPRIEYQRYKNGAYEYDSELDKRTIF